MYKKIIVAVDFSPTSMAAVEAAVDLGGAVGATTVLVHVVSSATEQVSTESGSSVRLALEHKLKKLAEEQKTRNPKASVDWGLVEGSPAEELTAFAARWGGDLVVVGTNSRTGVSRLFMGSVAQEVVKRSTVSVLVVRPSA